CASHELTTFQPVARDVLLEFLRTEFSTCYRCGRSGTHRMPVPKASLHPDDSSPPRQDDIGAAGQIAIEPAPDRKSESDPMQKRANDQFWLCVALTHARHQPAASD